MNYRTQGYAIERTLKRRMVSRRVLEIGELDPNKARQDKKDGHEQRGQRIGHSSILFRTPAVAYLLPVPSSQPGQRLCRSKVAR